MDSANQILQGTFSLFSLPFDLGFPPGWQKHPLTGQDAPVGHWSSIGAFAHGDIRFLWEPSRFSWVFTLVRAYARTGEERYPEAFWQLFASWLEANPPYWGVNWMCGQETALRAMALCFAVYAFAESRNSTPERVASLVSALSIHASRIAAFIEYARSQKNNHGISEGTGLFTIGLLFPELNNSAEWRIQGKSVIECEARRQIYDDGSYVQHSMNYHRVMLHDLAWSLRLGQENQDRLASDIYDKFRRSISFLHANTDPDSGVAPNYGANDGALILPLSDCNYSDMRPVLQACYYLAESKRLYPPGPWDEEMEWLNGSDAIPSGVEIEPSLSADVSVGSGGYYALHSQNSWLMLRGATFKDRPSHADQLHVDMWWRGENVLCDPGTYSYNAPPPFDDGFASTRYHNTVTVDRVDQMTRVSRFLWGDWAQAEVRKYKTPGVSSAVVEGEHDGYARKKVKHRRAVSRIDEDVWIIVDDLTGEGEHRLRLHWLTQDVPFHLISSVDLELAFNAGKMRMRLLSSVGGHMSVVRCGQCVAGEASERVDSAAGWQARYYGRKEGALSVAFETESSLPVRFVTAVSLGRETRVEALSNLQVITAGEMRITLSDLGSSPIVTGVRPEGPVGQK